MLRSLRIGKSSLVGLCGLGMWLSAGASPVSAATVDLTTNDSGTINGAIFEFRIEQPAGTGVIDSFVRIQNIGMEEGYNTSGRPVAFDEKTDPNFTRDLLFGDVPVVLRGGVSYLEFLLDINENNSTTGRLLSLDRLQIYTSATGSQTTTNISSLGTLRYDMDGPPSGDSSVLLDHARAEGSGKTDMALLVPLANFTGAQTDDFLYLYSRFGDLNSSDGDADAGFEEWAVVSAAAAVVPTPSAASMGMVGFLGVMCMKACKRRRLKA